MRSRFTAFALGEVDHLLASWDPSTRPERLDLDPSVRWTTLEITGRSQGGLLDTTGTVDFVALFRAPNGPGRLVEHSRFRRVERRWYYLDGDSQ